MESEVPAFKFLIPTIGSKLCQSVSELISHFLFFRNLGLMQEIRVGISINIP